MLFVTIACGAVSGFHSMVASVPLQNNWIMKRCQIVGYGAMLIEGVLAVISLGAAAMLTQEGMKAGLAEWGGAVGVFAHGLSKFMAGFGVPNKLALFLAL